MKIENLFFGLLSFLILSCNNSQTDTPKVAIIPQPVKIENGKGEFMMSSSTLIGYNSDTPELQSISQSFAEFLKPATGFEFNIQAVKEIMSSDNLFYFTLIDQADTMGTEGYYLEVTKEKVIISAKSIKGLFYGIQSILQLLPPEIFSQEKVDSDWKIPVVKIADEPRFSYRGMHLDVSRHFFPKEFVKKYIDLIAHYKMNVFHWHLTDDNGWRIEIKKYPKLTEIGALRVDRENEPWNKRRPPEKGEKATYGGFYTQDDIREIVAYAGSKYVEVIPEIEMPGHSCEVLAAYPEYACFQKEYYVQPGGYWPNVDILCAGKDETFRFLEDVLSEVITLFPSQYVHIGGDEATKTNWEQCRLCQNRIKKENLKDEKELQSYFIKRMEKFLTANNKKLIGWDEILEGGLASSATVMSWQGVEGGIASARMGHDVIMCPVSHCYFDYYQANPEFEPEGIGGFTTLKKVYHFEPVPDELAKEEVKYILGAQGNVWTEFIPTPSHAEYMALPRMTALAEVVWSDKEQKNWDSFRERLEIEKKRLDLMKVNYSKGSYHVDFKTTFDSVNQSFTVIPESEILNADIRYTLDGSEPSYKSMQYSSPIVIKATTTIKAGIFESEKLKEKIYEKTIFIHQGIGAKVTYQELPSERYFSAGASGLVDGLTGSKRHGDGFWQGFNGKNAVLMIDLKTVKTVSKISVNFLHNQRSWIFMPKDIDVQFSNDGLTFSGGKTIYPDIDQKSEEISIQKIVFDSLNASTRYIRLTAVNAGPLPGWHPGKGEPAWLFMDEVVIE